MRAVPLVAVPIKSNPLYMCMLMFQLIRADVIPFVITSYSNIVIFHFRNSVIFLLIFHLLILHLVLSILIMQYIGFLAQNLKGSHEKDTRLIS